ncbi:MAG: phytanoyl-CoA dioxygenase family protein [Gammaproteobacteria bacterium]|nr:phytanoyl-CoA dioxygenase family protein [Gammaproteobacteria bacterium]
MPSLKRLNYADAVASDSLDHFYERLVDTVCEDGAVVVEDALSVDHVTEIVNEMRPYIDTTPHGLHGLDRSRRVGALVARSQASHRAIAHPAVLHVCEQILGYQVREGKEVRITQTPRGEGRYPWRVGLTQIIDVGPGQQKQGVHRGNGLWVHDLAPDRLDPQIETMWALTDFTSENGATHVIPGSHRWPDVMQGQEQKGTRTWLGKVDDESVQATMQAGSVLIWTGWTVHGAGANTSDERRIGMNIDYSLSFLSQEENQFLSCPPSVARTLSEEMRRLIGYTQGGGALNYFADCLRPKVALEEGYDVMVPGAHGMEYDDH